MKWTPMTTPPPSGIQVVVSMDGDTIERTGRYFNGILHVTYMVGGKPVVFPFWVSESDKWKPVGEVVE